MLFMIMFLLIILTIVALVSLFHFTIETTEFIILNREVMTSIQFIMWLTINFHIKVAKR